MEDGRNEIKAFDEYGNSFPLSDMMISDILGFIKMSSPAFINENLPEKKELNYEEYRELTKYLKDKKVDSINIECIKDQISFYMMSGKNIVFLPRMDYQNLEDFFKSIRDTYFENKNNLENSILLHKGIMFKVVEQRSINSPEDNYSLMVIINKVTLENNTYMESLKSKKVDIPVNKKDLSINNDYKMKLIKK